MVCVLTLARPASAVELDRVFRMLDTNGDGVIDRKEFQINKTRIYYYRLRGMAVELSLSLKDTILTPEAFADADRDGDGRLSGAEFVQARFMRFEVYDRNRDLVIDPDEFRSNARKFIRE